MTRTERRRVIKQLDSIEARHARIIQTGDLELGEQVRDDAFDLMRSMSRRGAAFTEPDLLVTASKYALSDELMALNWRRAAKAGMSLAQGVAGCSAVRQDMTREDRERLASDVGWAPEVSAYAAHRAGWASVAPTLIETLTSVQIGERMQLRALEALADQPGHLETVARELQGRLHTARRELEQEIASVAAQGTQPDDRITGHTTAMRIDAIASTARYEASLPGSGYVFASPEDVPFLAAAMADRTVLYLVSGPVGGAVIKVGSSSSGTCESIEIPGLSIETTPGLITAINTASDRSKLRAAQLREILDHIGSVVWRPTLERWPELREGRPALIPVGDAALLPLFTALIDGVPAGDALDLVLAPSARGLLLSAGRQPALEGRSIVLANPARMHPEVRTLERVVAEAEAIATIHGTEPLIVTDPADVNEDDLVSALGTARLIHLACHGTADHADPLFSTLLIGDGLKLRRFWEHRLRTAPAIVLSACEVGGVGTHLPGEQLGFPAVLLASGARSVIGALWKVPEHSDTVRLMTALHDRMRSGMPANRALGSAVGALAEQGVTPSVWGPFSFFGSC